MKKKQSVILPGSYDPPTKGHLSLIRRAAAEYTEVYVVIFKNPNKTYTFSLCERMQMLMLICDELDNVLVSESDGLVIDYMREHGICTIIKGYRNEADLAYEQAQADWNLKNGGVPTLLWPAEEALRTVSSTAAREALRRGERAEDILPEKVIQFLRNR